MIASGRATGSSLRATLKEPALCRLLGNLEARGAELWAKDVVFHPYLTIHGRAHIEGVLDNYDRLVPPDVKRDLKPAEVLLLLASAWLHDVGYLFLKKGEDPNLLEVVREVHRTHHTRSKEVITLENTPFPQIYYAFDDPHHRIAVGALCEAHGLDQVGNLSNPLGIRMNLLASLLRLADVCDVACTRRSALFNALPLPNESIPHWAQLEYICKVNLETVGRAHRLAILATVPSRNQQIYEALIDTMAANWIRQELTKAHSIFQEHGFNLINNVVVHLTPDKGMPALSEKDLQAVEQFLAGFPQEGGPLAMQAEDDVLKQIRSRPRSVPQIADAVGMSEKAVENILGRLVNRDRVTARRGRNTISYVLREKEPHPRASV